MDELKRIESLRLYRELPSNGLVTMALISALTGWSRVTLWRKIKAGELPQPRKIGRALRWSKAEVDAFLGECGRQEAQHGHA